MFLETANEYGFG